MLAWPGAVRAQFRGGPDWMTAGGDAQRSSWIRTDPKISVERLRTPGFDLVWKIKLDHEPGAAATLSRYIGYRGFRSLAFTGSRSGDLTAIDTDLGRIEWKKSLPAGTGSGAASAGCPEGMVPEVTRATTAAFPGTQPARGGGLFGRSGPAKSAVGEAGEGAVILQEIAARQAMLANAGRGGPGRGPGMGFQRMPSFLDVLSSDGMLHRLYVSNGEEPSPPIPFLDRNANAHGLIVIDNVAYAATSQGCGGVPNGIWALDLGSKQTAHWTARGDIAGAEGPAFGPDGTVYAATTSGDLVALAPKTLEVKGTYHSGDQPFVTSPVVFEHRMKTLVAAATGDSRLHVVDAQSLAGTGYPAAVSGTMASWQDGLGRRWIAAPSKEAIAAWKVVSQDDGFVLQPGWTSRELSSPLAPLVINGVLFAVSNSTAPVVYALDASTGKELWNSGRKISGQVRNGRLTGSETQIYLGTSDGTIYSFGFPIEH
jgi:outer membrane protein assembly factor BamB